MMGRITDALLSQNEIGIAVKVGKEILENLLSRVSELLSTSMELDEFREIYTTPLDKIVLAEEEKTGNKFAGGEFKVFYMDERSFGVSCSLYFQDENKQWTKMTAKSNPMRVTYLSPQAYQELVEKRTIVYDVEVPSAEARKKYEEEKNRRPERPRRVE